MRVMGLSRFLLGLILSVVGSEVVTAKPLATSTNSVGMTMVRVPAGEFVINYEKELPAFLRDEKQKGLPSQVKIKLSSGFWMASTEVTQAQYFKITGKNPSQFPVSEKTSTHPMDSLKHVEMVQFANALSKQEGLVPCYDIKHAKAVSGTEGGIRLEESCDGYRLPTEAEWVYAALGGESYKYAGSDDATAVGWVEANSGGRPHPVAQKKSNGYGLYDMTGNLVECVEDRPGFSPEYYRKDVSDPMRKPVGDNHAVLGGAFIQGTFGVMDSFYGDPLPGCFSLARVPILGFRLVRSDSRR